MARGFGATFGVGTTDLITLPFNTRGSTRSYHMVVNRNGAGGGSLGRMFDVTSGAEQERLLFDSGGTQYTYERTYAAGVNLGSWAIAAPSTGAFHTIGVSIDSSAAANDPLIYLDGTSQVLAVDSNPASGTGDTTALAYTIGNRASDSARNWDGILSEFAVWSVILTAAEFALLGGGLSALCVRPSSLLSYVSQTDASRDSIFSGAITTTGTALQTHPVIKRPYLYADLSGRTQPMAGGING